MNTEYSRKYYFAGPLKEFRDEDVAMRHAEWKEREMRNFWGERFVRSRIIRCTNYVQVEVVYRK